MQPERGLKVITALEDLENFLELLWIFIARQRVCQRLTRERHSSACLLHAYCIFEMLLK